MMLNTIFDCTKLSETVWNQSFNSTTQTPLFSYSVAQLILVYLKSTFSIWFQNFASDCWISNMEVINFYSYVHHAEIAKNHLKVHFCIFLLLSFKFISFQWPRPNKNPHQPFSVHQNLKLRRVKISQKTMRKNPFQNFSPDKNRHMGGITYWTSPLIFPFTGNTSKSNLFPWRTLSSSR